MGWVRCYQKLVARVLIQAKHMQSSLYNIRSLFWGHVSPVETRELCPVSFSVVG